MQFPGTEAEKRKGLLRKIAEAAQAGVDFIQLREKDLTSRELERLARDAVELVRLQARPHRTKILINSRTDIAVAAGADGVHLTANDIPASEARAIWGNAAKLTSGAEAPSIRIGFGGTAEAVPFPSTVATATRAGLLFRGVIGVSCHTPEEVRMAAAQGADFVVFAPVFEKSVAQSNATTEAKRKLVTRRTAEEGIRPLREACAAAESIGSAKMPVLALGGVTLENAKACIAAGAAGMAAIRLFQENDMAEVVTRLRSADMLA